MSKANSELFREYCFKCRVIVKNRIVMAPMTTESAFENGMVTDEELAYYAARSQDTGMIITACAYVTRDGKAFSGQLGADNDIFVPGLAKMAATIKAHGAKAILQLQHGGILCDPAVLIDSQPIGPSEFVDSNCLRKKARSMTVKEIEAVVAGFATATRRAIEAGFDGIEIHGANHYLLHQFFSAHTNHRTDAYGGTLERRMSFCLQVLKAVLTVRDEMRSDFIIGYRMSPEEKEYPGITVEDSLVFVDKIAALVDYIHLSTTKLMHKSWKNPKETKTAVERVSTVIGQRCALIAVGYITQEAQALMALNINADFAAVGRAMLATPDWTSKLLKGEDLSDSEVFDFARNEEYLKLPAPMAAWLQSPNFRVKKK